MDYFLSKYKQACQQEFEDRGFKSYRNNRYRVVNDVFQSFNLHRSVSGNAATVEFLAVPLADEYISKSRCGPDHLKLFENEWVWFPYENKNEESIEECIKQMVYYTQKYLMPFFEATCSCIKIYNQLQGDKYIRFLQQAKRNAALKVKDWELANHYLNEEIEQIRSAIVASKKNSNNIDFIKSMEEQCQKKIEVKQEFQRHITDKDFLFFEKWIEMNETNSLRSLKWKTV
ncbi:MAG: hypothetical protein LUG52_03445 [Clostridia bacterium]|nr:hypothetical protein [Clostridia bacterium]